MSDAVSKLKVLFEADSSALDKAFDSADKKASGLTGVFGKVTGALGSIGLAGMGISAISGAVGGVTGSFGELIGAAEGVGDAAARIGLVWNEEMVGIVKDNATIANSLGLTKSAYLDQVGALGQLATSLGVNKDAAADMATGLTELGPKLAAYAGVEGTVASDALEKALMGKTKGLAALGIAITDADQQSAALALGLGTEAAKWTEAEKAQINYAAVLDKTGAAQSAWADNQGDVEVSMQRFSAAIDDAKAALGEKLLPIIAPVAEALAGALPGAIDTAVAAFQPLFDALGMLASTVGPAFEVLKAQLSGGSMDGAAAVAESLRSTLGPMGDALFNAATAAGQFGNAIGKFFGGDSAGGFEKLGQALWNTIDAISAATGLDLSGLTEFLFGAEDSDAGGAWDSIVDGVQATIDAIQDFATWVDTIVQSLGGWKTVIATVAVGLAAFSIITTVIGWVSGLMAAWAALGAGITAAGGIVGAIIAVLGGPLTIAIAAVAAIIAGLALAWKNDWGGMRDKVAEIVGWIQANVVPAIQAAFGQVQAVLGNLVAWWQANGAEVIAVVSGIVSFVVKQFEFLFNILSNVVKAGIALITGDWRGLGEAVGAILGNIIGMWVHMIQGLITAVVAIFKGLWPAVKGAVSSGVTGIISWLKGQGDEMGKMTLDGLIAGIKAGAARVLKAITDLAGGLVSGFMDAIDAHSPSKVFEQIGQWITLGLASGIQKEDYKAVEALAKIITQMTTVANGLADFGKKIADMIVPSDEQIAAAKEKYLRMTIILTDFIKSISYLGSLLPVSSMGQAGPGQIRAINAGLTQLSQSFPAIKELEGMTAQDLLTGGEADWAGRLADTVGKIAGVWGGIADSMTKIASAKFPSDDQLKAIKESTIRIALWATGALNTETLPSAGAEEFAKSIKAIVEALATVAGLSLDKIAAATDAQLQTAGASLTSLATWARAMMEDWIALMPDAKARAEFVAQLQEFATMIKAAADIVKSADIGDLSKMVVLQVSDFGPVKDALGRMQQLTTEIVQAWAKGAGDATARAQWITDLKDFAATMGAAADILKIAAIGEIKAALEYDAAALVDVLTRLRDQLEPTMAGIVAAWDMTNEKAALATERMKAFSDWIGAALSLAKLANVGKLVGEVELDVIEIRAVLKWVRDNLAPEMVMVADAWKVASEEAERQTARMKEFGDWIGAAIGLAKLADVGTLAGEVEADVLEIRAVLKWVRDKLAPEMMLVADAWAVASKEAERQTGRMKEFADWISAAVGMAKLADVGTLTGEVEADVIELRAVLNWVKDKLAPEMVKIAEAWGMTAESSKPIIEQMKAFADFVGAAVNMAKSADLSDLVAVTGTSGLAGKLEIVKTNILAMYGMLGEIAKDITTEDANARAALATALGSIGGGLGEFGGGIGGIMEMVQSKLFGSSSSRGGLGHTQRTRTNRADFFAQQLGDTVKRAVGAVQDALAGITLTVDDKKVAALAALGDAFGKIADGLTKLAEAKLPDAKQLASIMAAMTGSQGALGLGGTGGAGGPLTLNLSNPSLVFATPISASVQVTTNPTIMIGHATIETLATMIETKLAEKFVIGSGGGGSPITPGTP